MTDFERNFEGRAVLQKLLESSGTLADVEDVANAFTAAIGQKAPPQAVIEALWDDEPRFQSAKEASRLFSNLLGLYDALESGAQIDLSVKQKVTKRAKVDRPEPLGDALLTSEFIDAAWRYFDDFPNEKKKIADRFENVFHEMVTWIESQNLSDEQFSLSRNLAQDLFCILELSEKTAHPPTLKQFETNRECPPDLRNYIEASLLEIESDESIELNEVERKRVVEVVCQCGALLIPFL